MSNATVEIGRRRQAALLALLIVAIMGVALGWSMARNDTSGVLIAHAYKGANYNCPGGDTTKTSALTVTHHTAPAYIGTSTVVEPDTGESFIITATWEAGAYPPGTHSEVAGVDVDWNGSRWVLSNTSLTTNIVDIDICQGGKCTDGESVDHSWTYKLYVDLTDPEPGTNFNLRDVAYSAVDIDDGYTVEDPAQTQGDCYLDASVSPTSSSFTAWDWPPTWDSNRCPYTCYTAGASMTIEYD